MRDVPRSRRHGNMRHNVASGDRAERRLAKRLARRDPDALRELYALHGRDTFGFLVGCCGDRAAAEDVQQQVFLEAWQRADRYDPERGGLLGWLLTIARSRAIDHLRRRVPEPRDPASAVALADGADEARGSTSCSSSGGSRRARPAPAGGGRPAAAPLLPRARARPRSPRRPACRSAR